ncbi:MAG: PQQ-binding-like beta-propeller repeat protein, partial [Pseudomonadota bacterium]
MTRILFVLVSVFATTSVAFCAETSTAWADLTGAEKKPQNWVNHHGTLDGQRYSRLTEIDKKTVKDLRLAFTHAVGGGGGGGIWEHGGLEGTPVAEDGYLYITDGWGGVYKLDVRKNGKLVWRMDPDTDRDWAGEVTCCGVDNRGVALWKDKVISHSLDGRIIVTDKASGEIEREIEVADPEIGETITAAPLIVRDMVITGVAGGEFGVRGWLTATDLNTGDRVWRTYTIPEPGEPGSETWKPGPESASHAAWEHGGGATWITGSYDPETNTLYWGVGNPAPDWDNAFRPGDNLFSNSGIALDADTGEMKWHFQYTPNDPYDFDGVNELTLVNTSIGGNQQKAVLHADRNGFAYALDAASGKFL